MILEAHIGILRDRLVVEGEEYALRHERGGWITVPPAGKFPGGRVRYDWFRDRVRIETPGSRTLLEFRWRHSGFRLRGRAYRVGPMIWGHVMVSCDERPVATGRVTLHGVRLGYVAPELEAIASALVVGLAYRALALWMAAGAAGAGGAH